MPWPRVKLGDVSPSISSDRRFEPDDPVWHLTLDQIESGTGRILEKVVSPAYDAGVSSHAFDERNVLYSKLRPYLNKVLTPDEPGMATTELVTLRPDPERLDRKFLTYYLRSDTFLQFANQVVAGVKMPRMIMDKFWDYEIPLPPPPEQRRIVEILDQADALRKLRREADALAERILPALFYKMFGDPVRNEMGWETKSIGEIVTLVTSGLTPRGGEENYVKEGPYFLRSQNIQMNGLVLDDIACLPMEIHESMARTRVMFGDVLLNITGASIGRVAWYDVQDHEANVNQHVCIMRLNELAKPEYVSFILSTPYGQSLISRSQTGATRQGLNHENVRGIRIPLPPTELQAEFAALVRDARMIQRNGDQASENIESLFKTVLHRAFTGELTARWREKNEETHTGAPQ